MSVLSSNKGPDLDSDNTWLSQSGYLLTKWHCRKPAWWKSSPMRQKAKLSGFSPKCPMHMSGKTTVSCLVWVTAPQGHFMEGGLPE
jgi:hypothetical protein